MTVKWRKVSKQAILICIFWLEEKGVDFNGEYGFVFMVTNIIVLAVLPLSLSDDIDEVRFSTRLTAKIKIL